MANHCAAKRQPLYKSNGKIPAGFLRGCGLPDELITHLPALTNKPIEFHSCFISYSHADKSFARRLHDAWETDNPQFEREFGKVVKALQTGDAGREPPPPSLL